jgi:hypothetical protein
MTVISVDLAHQLVAIGAGADGVDARQVAARQREPARIAARRPDQRAVSARLTVGQRQLLFDRVDRGDLDVEDQVDALLLPERGRANVEAVEGFLAGEVFLRQRRALVRRLGLAADHGHGAGESMLAQRDRALRAAMTGSNNNDVCVLHARSQPLNGSFR